MQDDPTIETNIKVGRLSALKVNRGTSEKELSTKYSKFIKRVKFALPVMALILVVLIFTWNNFEDDKIIAIKEEDVREDIQQEIGKNELIRPKFESIDDKGQPFTLTANKAIQESGAQGEMSLENPKGFLATNNGKQMTVSALNGIYHQIKQSLKLNDNVILTHSDGYKMRTNILNVDLAADKAWSKQPVRVTGPEGKIDAQGVEASIQNETIIFNGPAKMQLNTDNNALQFGAALQ